MTPLSRAEPGWAGRTARSKVFFPESVCKSLPFSTQIVPYGACKQIQEQSNVEFFSLMLKSTEILGRPKSPPQRSQTTPRDLPAPSPVWGSRGVGFGSPRRLLECSGISPGAQNPFKIIRFQQKKLMILRPSSLPGRPGAQNSFKIIRFQFKN